GLRQTTYPSCHLNSVQMSRVLSFKSLCNKAIHIPKQSFDTPEQNQFCENLSFTPWHALPEHKPLGAINRMRKIIYENISRVRHDINSAPRQEPKN
ncbi:hypothetical protein RFZ45_05205, partial [Acinetobacter baumannii]|nr:hypothetical protein [Acinetobacter baumannii]